jgi:hypothetical protein
MPSTLIPNFTPSDRLTVTISDSSFQDDAMVDFGQRVVVQDVTFIDSGHLQVQIKVRPEAIQGPRNVTVTNPDGKSAQSFNSSSIYNSITLLKPGK